MESRVPGGALLHPVALAAIALLALNDHVGKDAFPGLVTGKLSDFAGLAFFPLVLLAAFEWVRGVTRSDRALIAAMAATAIVFASVKLGTPMTEAYRWGLGLLQAPWRGHVVPVAIATDPTDLVALPAVLVAGWIGRVPRGTPVPASGSPR